MFDPIEAERIRATVVDAGPRTAQEGRGRLKDTMVEYEGRELEDKEVRGQAGGRR